MPIIILHGKIQPNLVNKIISIRSQFDPLSTTIIDGKTVKVEQALQELSSGGLFSEKRLVILENFDDKFSLQDLTPDESITALFIINKVLPANSKFLKIATSLKAQIIAFDEPQDKKIFTFLDQVSDKNPKALNMLDTLLDEYGGQYVLTMLTFQFRRFLQSPQKLPAFLQTKISNQKKSFSLEKISEIYQSILETDYRLKRGLSEEKTALTLLIQNIIH